MEPGLETLVAGLRAKGNHARAEYVEKRTCGSCTACCLVMAVEDTTESYEWCQHKVAGGCGIYATRPEACRRWFCGWRLGIGPESMKPDVSGVVLALRSVPETGETVADFHAFGEADLLELIRFVTEWWKGDPKQKMSFTMKAHGGEVTYVSATP